LENILLNIANSNPIFFNLSRRIKYYGKHFKEQ
jgi:hypothetical protein